MKKNKTLRLHRQHDLDLITLYRADGFSFSKEVRNILVAYVNCESYEPPEIDYEDVDLGYIPTTIQYHLALDPSNPRELAVLDMLHDEIKYGYMNSFIKALIRAYIPHIPFIGYGTANGFVTRQITANDVGMKLREAQRTEQDKVAALTNMANDLVLEGTTSTSIETVPINADSDAMVLGETPIQVKLEHTEPEQVLEQIKPVLYNTESDTDIDDSDDDDFDDFFKAAQAFTSI